MTAIKAGAPAHKARPVQPHAHARPRAAKPGPSWYSTWLLLLPVVTVLPYLLAKLHYHLPAPRPPTDASGNPQPSEEVVLEHIGALETIGFRTVGTHEAVLGEQYVAGQVGLIKERCDAGGVLRCEVWVQRGSGYHAFSLIGHDVLKLYAGITNVVLKISALDPPSGPSAHDDDSILLGAHIDSTLPSPGAADDGMGVGVMLDVARVLVDRAQPFDNSVIFMWNSGEETLQDGSHMYSTQHETRHSVKAIINLEAAGSTGGALLFQATSREMIEAYSHVPHPKGTVIAADVFASGVLMSDTDFVQFEEYLNVSGLDMATVGHSYYYHTRKDTLANIESGSAQHFTDNIMAVLDHLLSPGSPLAKPDWSPPDMVYLSLYDRVFFHFPVAQAAPYYRALAAVAAALALGAFRGDLKVLGIALLGTPPGFLAGVISANALAGVLTLADKRMTWFSHEGLPILLYGPPALIGYLTTQLLLSRLLTPAQRRHLERAHYLSQALIFSFYMILLQLVGVRSAYLMALLAGIMAAGAVGGMVARLVGLESVAFGWQYVLATASVITLGVEAFTLTLDIFVPLTGRMGKTAPTEFIIATITSACSLVFAPTAAPLFARLTRRTQIRVLWSLVLGLALVLGVFLGPWWSPYDATHPKRMAVQYTYNHTSAEHTAHLAFMDTPLNAELVAAFHARYAAPDAPLTRTTLTPNESDWDTLYPVSSFLDTYRWPLEPRTHDLAFAWPAVKVEARRQREGEVVHLNLRFDHAGLVWPVFAFEADITDWTFEFDPPRGRRRHHIKAATSVHDHSLELDLKVRLAEDEKVQIHWSAIDINQMVPGTAARLGPDMPASAFLMDMDAWAEATYGGALELLLSGVVVGVLEV
ncbi:hypothetical protein Q5752_004585 [Cryptotrichosporon argae]